MTQKLIIDYLDSKIGTVITVYHDGALCALDFKDHEDRCLRLLKKSYPQHHLEHLNDPYGFKACLDRYMAGDFLAFSAVNIALTGTEFQQEVWQNLRTIPAGTTMSYGALARNIGRPKAARAVGYANSLNPIALVLPCHRVIGQDGSLTGFAGGLGRKGWLLTHEKTRSG
ncbi:MAG: cysteine methyltransferase [Alphaproteobacteria bacterium]|nr:MAG: cysteine methyltransferase [Alphaproteobacteria bacterium]